MPRKRLLSLVIVGLLAGFFSGLFGVGGGIVIVPLLVMLLAFPQRLASGTSLAAILPTAVAGSLGYAMRDEVDWTAAGCLAVGAIAGSLIGTWLLQRISQQWLRWGFIAFQLVMAVSLFLLVPSRDAELDYTVGSVLALIALGLFTGTLSGLLGVGGGVIVVPMMMLLFGMGDLLAKGTSLVMMIPTSITGTLSNLRRNNADIRAAAVIGLLAIPASFGGIAVAAAIPPQLGSILFALLLLFTASQLIRRSLKERRDKK